MVLFWDPHMYNSYQAHLCSTDTLQPCKVGGIYRAEEQTKKLYFDLPIQWENLMQE